MQESFPSRLKHAWNVFLNRDPTNTNTNEVGYFYRPDRKRITPGTEKTIVTSIYNRIALDVSSISIQHVRLDTNNRYLETIDSGLNNCLTLEANVDQTGKAFVQDIVFTMLEEGCAAVVPVDTGDDIDETSSYVIETMRVGKVVEWYPRSVKVRLYNDRTGRKQDVVLSKKSIALIDNPFYSVMNEPNSTMQRLIRKLNLLDVVDEQTSSGKLDLIIQLPYIVKTQARREQAENRRKDIEEQLAGSKYGIAYTDGTEHITQLNRPAENNLMSQIEFLTDMLYGQLGMTKEIMDGTASEQVMLNYTNRTIRVILDAIVDSFKRVFLTKTARSQRQSIMVFNEPFKLVPVSQIAEIADKFTRNEIMTSNEIRQILGMRPSSDPNADVLRNKNLNASSENKQDADSTDLPIKDDFDQIVNESDEPESTMQSEYLK